MMTRYEWWSDLGELGFRTWPWKVDRSDEETGRITRSLLCRRLSWLYRELNGITIWKDKEFAMQTTLLRCTNRSYTLLIRSTVKSSTPVSRKREKENRKLMLEVGPFRFRLEWSKLRFNKTSKGQPCHPCHASPVRWTQSQNRQLASIPPQEQF